MKWVALALILLSVPLITSLLKSNSRATPFLWGLLGFLPFVLGPWHLYIAPYSTAMWPGFVKGWEVSLLDAIAVAVILSSKDRWYKQALVIPFLAYIFVTLLSVYQADFPKMALSYIIQLLRAFLLFLAVSRVVVTDRGEKAVITGLVVGISVQAGYAIWAWVGGALQTGGSLGHQNLLGFVSHLVLMPAFALFLSGRWQRIALVGILSGLVAVILTASRATIAFSAMGLALTLLLSMSLRFTSRKAMLGMVGLIVLAASYPLARATLERRFEVQKSTFFTEDKEREAFERAAHAMLDNYPLGVGPNHYVVIANTEGYSARAGVAWRTQSRATSVHNSYLLVAVESGYLGLIALLAFLFSSIWRAFSGAWRFRKQSGSEVMIGLGCGILAMAVHGLFEWMFVAFPTQYLFAVSLGLIAGLQTRFIRATSRGRQTGNALSNPTPGNIGALTS